MNTQALLYTLDQVGFMAFRFSLSFFWQSSIVIAAALAISYVLRRSRPAVRYTVVVAALLSLPALPLLNGAYEYLGAQRAEIAVLPSYTIVSPGTAGAADGPTVPPSVRADLPVNTAGPETASQGRLTVPPPEHPSVQTTHVTDSVSSFRSPADYPWAVLFVLYCVILAAFVGLILYQRIRMHGWIQTGTPLTDATLLDVFFDTAAKMGITRDILVIEHHALASPLTFRTLKPVIVLPPGLGDSLSPRELRAVAAHELSHIRRNDPLVLSFLAFLRAVLFFHPLVWFGVRHAAYLAERECDARVVEYTGETVIFADTLTRIADTLTGKMLTTELAAGFIISKSVLFRRVKAILALRAGAFRRLSRGAQTGLAALCIMVLAVSLAVPLVSARDRGPAVTVAGIVTDDGEPVSGATVWFNDINARTLEKVGKTGRDGRFSVEIEKARLSADNRSLPSLVVWKKGHVPGLADFSRIAGYDNLLITCGSPVTLSGTVKKAGETPIRGAEVSIFWLFGFGKDQFASARFDEETIPPFVTKTDAGGRFSLPGLPRGCGAWIRVRMDGFVNTLSLQEELSSGAFDITLKPEAAITGRFVYGHSGAPANGIHILAKKKGVPNLDFYTVSGRDGSFAFRGLASGSYSLYVTGAGADNIWAAEPVTDITVQEGDTVSGIELSLVEGSLIEGRVVDKDTGAPIPWHFVSLHDPGDNPYVNMIDYTATGVDGSFSFRVFPGVYDIMTVLPEGYIYPEWRIQSNRVDDFRIPVTVKVAQGGTAIVDQFALSKGLVLNGRTVSSNGEAVGDVVLTFGEGFKRKTLQSGSDGRFSISGLKEGESLTIQAQHDTRKMRGTWAGEIHPGITADVALESYQTTSIRGKLVSSEGGPVPNGRVTLSWFGDGLNLRMGRDISTTLSANDGAYAFDGLIVGDKYYLLAQSDKFKYDDRLHPELMFDAAVNMTVRDDIVLEPLGDRWLEVVLRDQDGRPVVGAISRTASSDATGLLRKEQLDVLAVRVLRVTHDDYGSFFFPWLLTNHRHELTMVKGTHTLNGTVVDGDGKPTAGVSIYVEPMRHKSGKDYQPVQTEPDGAFTIGGIIDGSVDIMVYVRGTGFKRFKGLTADGNIVKLVFDKPDPQPERPWNFNPDGRMEITGKDAPALTLSRWVKGSPVKLSGLKGKVVVLDFMVPDEPRVSTSTPSLTKMRYIQAIQEQYGSEGVVCIGIHSHTGDTSALEAAVAQYGITYSVAVDAPGSTAESKGKMFDSYSIYPPVMTVLIDRDGLVIPDVRDDELEKKIKQLLKGVS